ncbi:MULTISPECIES: DUF4181 domain-containing protein [Cytobacillus]|uniref:DUF4181 domain-containing protein n=1 Tax=Cytobacillus TaxID=2675230 RepID=UPI00203DEEC1|nr:DUF4181 domain-containing protein [Cytobacillus firmus]MCM3706319.1 DUF4181 domain-containing protein [Cytobacillus firmus]
MKWLAIIIYCLLFSSAFALEKMVKRKWSIPKKRRYTKKFNRQHKVIEALILFVFILGIFTASITVEENGVQISLNPIPYHWWLALLVLAIGICRGVMVRKYASHSNEHMLEFAFAAWTPLMVLITYYVTTAFFY